MNQQMFIFLHLVSLLPLRVFPFRNQMSGSRSLNSDPNSISPSLCFPFINSLHMVCIQTLDAVVVPSAVNKIRRQQLQQQMSLGAFLFHGNGDNPGRLGRTKVCCTFCALLNFCVIFLLTNVRPFGKTLAGKRNKLNSGCFFGSRLKLILNSSSYPLSAECLFKLKYTWSKFLYSQIWFLNYASIIIQIWY